MDPREGRRTVKHMWWIRKRAKTIVPVLLIVAVACGGLLIFTSSKSTTPGDTESSGTKDTTEAASGEGTPEGNGVRVYKDENGRIIVSNGENIQREVTLELPQNCKEAAEMIDKHLAEHKSAIDAEDDARITMVIYQRLAQDLCSWRQYNDTASGQLSKWFQQTPGQNTPVTAPPQDSNDAAVPPIEQQDTAPDSTPTTAG